MLDILRHNTEEYRILLCGGWHVLENIAVPVPICVRSQNRGAVILAIQRKLHRCLCGNGIGIRISSVVPYDIHLNIAVRLHDGIGDGKFSEIDIIIQRIIVILLYCLGITPRKVQLFQGILNHVPV